MPNDELSKTLFNYPNKWVALSEDASHVVSSGETIQQAVNGAKKQGVQKPVITRVPNEYSNFVL